MTLPLVSKFDAIDLHLQRLDERALAHFREVASLDTTGPAHKEETKSWWRRVLKRVTCSSQAVDVLNEQEAILVEYEAEMANATRLRDRQLEKVKNLRLATAYAVDLVATRRTLGME